jgi:hypothetical protein
MQNEVKETTPRISIPIWKTIDIGTFKDTTALYEALMEKVDRVVIKSFSNSSMRRGTVNLVKIRLIDLGIHERILYRDVVQIAKDFGLQKCIDEIILQLRLQFGEISPEENGPLIAMDTFYRDSVENVYKVDHRGLARRPVTGSYPPYIKTSDEIIFKIG